MAKVLTDESGVARLPTATEQEINRLHGELEALHRQLAQALALRNGEAQEEAAAKAGEGASASVTPLRPLSSE